jgi:flagellin-like protein
MLKKAKKKNSNKRGLSEIVGYAILIAIAIGLAVAVFSWYKIVANGVGEKIDCKEGTSISIEDYSCKMIPGGGLGGADITNFTLKIKNNGNFNVFGVIVLVGNDSTKEPYVMLQNIDPTSFGPALGKFQFTSELKPNDYAYATFVNSSINVSQIRRVSIQPFIFINGKQVVCSGTLIKEPITSNGC